MKTINEIGNKYNFLKILEESSEYSKYGKMWKCECDCGNIVHHLGVDLRRGHFQSCGCKRGYNGGPPRTCQLRTLNHHFASYKNAKRAKELGFVLSKLEFEKICRTNCYYCGAAPQPRRNKYGSDRKGPLWAYDYLSGIDRLDNTKGYTLENAVACCGKCNIMKGSSTKAEFLAQAQRIIYFQNQ